MSQLSIKIRENKNRRLREGIIASANVRLENFLSNTEYSHEVSSIKFAAFSTWDQENDQQTTTRGKIEGWTNLSFPHWEDLIDKIKEIKCTLCPDGFFFIDAEGPYFEMNLHKFITLINDISQYAVTKEHYDIGWVGKNQDSGILLEFNHTSFCRNEFEISIWGIK